MLPKTTEKICCSWLQKIIKETWEKKMKKVFNRPYPIGKPPKIWIIKQKEPKADGKVLKELTSDLNKC